MSRHSTAAFTAVDFEYSGNTGDVQHLIKSTSKADRHKANLNFELNLRTYKSLSKYTAEVAWEYPRKKESFDPLKVDKTSFGYTMQLNKQSQVKSLKDMRHPSHTEDKGRRNLGVYLNTAQDQVKH